MTLFTSSLPAGSACAKSDAGAPGFCATSVASLVNSPAKSALTNDESNANAGSFRRQQAMGASGTRIVLTASASVGATYSGSPRGMGCSAVMPPPLVKSELLIVSAPVRLLELRLGRVVERARDRKLVLRLEVLQR